MYLFQQSECLTVIDRIGKTGSVVLLRGSFARDFSSTDSFVYKYQQGFFGIADRNGELPVFVTVFAGQGNGASPSIRPAM